jgi:hypothetical protein
MDTVQHPLKALTVTMRGIDTEGPLAPEIPLDGQRPAQYPFATHVQKKLAEIKAKTVSKPAARTG